MSVEPHGYGYWFGEPWPSDRRRAPICEDDTMRVPVPAGQTCIFCTEWIQPGDRGVLMPALAADGTSSIEAAHIECQFANTVGGAAHLDGGRCEHCGGEGDPYAGLSYRESSLRVWQAYTTIGTY